MSERLKILWTDAVAYVALILGAGLSIAGNVADTFRVRGQATDPLDIVMAIAWPALVVLMVEVFVSARWIGLPDSMQVLRWLGTLSIGGMAMRVSWVHLHDLMLSRGQKADVATMGPLAIDLLAIMATALILAGRRGHAVAKLDKITTDTLPDGTRVDIADGQIVGIGRSDVQDDVQPVQEVVHMDTTLDTAVSMDSYVDKPVSTPVQEVVHLDRPVSNAVSRNYDLDRDLDRMDKELDKILSEADPIDTPYWDTDGQAVHYARTGRSNGLAIGQIAELLSGWYGVSTKTIRRAPWWKQAMSVL